jgi:hypothetical protein
VRALREKEDAKMNAERWGSLSVADHLDTMSLAANVLLYDRLVIPVMTAQPDRNEYAYWNDRGWDPSLQARRLEELDALAVKRPWDAHRRALFSTRAQQLAAEAQDAERLDLTRQILAQEQVLGLGSGANVTVIAAYNSMRALRKDFALNATSKHLAAQTLLLVRRLAIPKAKDPEDVLRAAIDLSLDPEFRRKRADLFDWQLGVIERGISPENAVDRINDLVNQYNQHVVSAVGAVRWKLAFTLTSVALGFVSSGFAAATAAAAVSLVQFAVLDAVPAINAGRSQPVAMFHDIRKRTRLTLPVN